MIRLVDLFAALPGTPKDVASQLGLGHRHVQKALKTVHGRGLVIRTRVFDGRFWRYQYAVYRPSVCVLDVLDTLIQHSGDKGARRIRGSGRMTQHEILEDTGRSVGSVAGALQRLQRKGLISRSQGPPSPVSTITYAITVAGEALYHASA